ncbi:DUF551 domain-containing protein [Pseudomonas putida]|uniref:DUF551 domain-containing protein n=1 Tax=Pseudomonas putida TaxID=303 RepID=UPI00041CB02C|nr:DUF551 domain-containing protein [Pseudomonas putida]
MSGWIKCSDRLPVSGYVLTYRPQAPSGNKVAAINYDYHQERFGGQYPVTHWQPLPEPPTE